MFDLSHLPPTYIAFCLLKTRTHVSGQSTAISNPHAATQQPIVIDCSLAKLSDSISRTSVAWRMIQAKIQSELLDTQGVFFHEQNKTERPLAMGRCIRPSPDGMHSTDPKQKGFLACWPGAGQWVSRGQVGQQRCLAQIISSFFELRQCYRCFKPSF